MSLVTVNMSINEQNSSIEQLIKDSKKIAIIPSQVAGFDAFAAALGLFITLKEKEKDVSLVYPDNIPEGFEDLVSSDEVMSDPSIRDLTVSIDYGNSPAQRVNYSTVNDVLTLKISPVTSSFKLDNIKSKVEGPGFDLIFVIGAQVKEDLGVSYSQLGDEFRKATIVNIDNTGFNVKFGNVNIVDPSMNNLSLLVLNTMVKNGLSVTQRAAKALLKGISFKVVN